MMMQARTPVHSVPGGTGAQLTWPPCTGTSWPVPGLTVVAPPPPPPPPPPPGPPAAALGDADIRRVAARVTAANSCSLGFLICTFHLPKPRALGTLRRSAECRPNSKPPRAGEHRRALAN